MRSAPGARPRSRPAAGGQRPCQQQKGPPHQCWAQGPRRGPKRTSGARPPPIPWCTSRTSACGCARRISPASGRAAPAWMQAAFAPAHGPQAEAGGAPHEVGTSPAVLSAADRSRPRPPATRKGRTRGPPRVEAAGLRTGRSGPPALGRPGRAAAKRPCQGGLSWGSGAGAAGRDAPSSLGEGPPLGVQLPRRDNGTAAPRKRRCLGQGRFRARRVQQRRRGKGATRKRESQGNGAGRAHDPARGVDKEPQRPIDPSGNPPRAPHGWTTPSRCRA